MIRSTALGTTAHVFARAISIVTAWLPMAGILGPLQFTLAYLWQSATRPGHDAIPMMVSALTLVLSGLLLVAFAAGLRRAVRFGVHAKH